MADLAKVFPGWNVWAVWQQKDLNFEPLHVGESRDRRLRIWVEDAVRLGAPGTVVADPIDLKGSQIEVLPGEPAGLSQTQRKEDVSGPAMLLDGPGELRFVRFYNRGPAGSLVWPHDGNYLLDAVYQPDPKNETTSGPAPNTIGSTVGGGVQQTLGDAFSGLGTVAAIAGVTLALYGTYRILGRNG